jgi:histidinol-phosphate aminotransferase
VILPRKSVQDARAYCPPLEGRREAVRLDFNENTEGFPGACPGLPEAVVSAYPEYGAFLDLLGETYDIPAGNLLLVNGSGEAIFLTAFAFLEPGVDTAVTSQPTFSLIPHSLRIVGARVREVPATRDLGFDLAGIEKALEDGAKLALFASPDNPTGDVLDPEAVLAWCRAYPRTLFAVDEAYAEYGDETLLAAARGEENLLVFRTFSKAWGLGGLRLGFVTGSAALVEALLRVRSPYSVNAAAVYAAGRLLPKIGQVREKARELKDRKTALAAEVRVRGFRVKDGAANFFLVGAGPDAGNLCASLREDGVLIRDRSSLPRMEGYVRVTAGTEGENRAFLGGLDRFCRDRALIFDLDGTLVDTSTSYDSTVAELVQRLSGKALADGELRELRTGGGFNDDWDSSCELLRRRGKEVQRDEVVRQGREIYLGLAREQEKLLLGAGVLRRLARRYRLFILTGRPRNEYEPVWAQELDPLFERVYCKDDFPGLRPKPAPDMLKEIVRRHGLSGGFYIGDALDDVAAARGAGLGAVALTRTLGREAFEGPGADLIIEEPSEIEEGFRL